MNDVLNDEFSLETTLKQALKLADELDFPLVSIRIAEALDQLHRDTFGGELD